MSHGIALLGAGIFARDEHLPAIEACPCFTLKAIYSRSRKSADALAKLAKGRVDTYFDAPSPAGRSLDDILDRTDVDAVIIALPITVQPGVIRKAITAGKHVLSEKPIAPDVKTATELLKWYKKKKRDELWSVAENFRFMDQMTIGADQIKKLNGNVVTFSMRLYGFIGEEDEYYQKEWRRLPEHPGGCLLDCGVHFIAAIRHLLAAGSQTITSVAAFTSQLQPRLGPLDTIHATMRLSNGKNGTFNLSFGAEFKFGFELQVVTDKGAVTVTPQVVVLQYRGSDGEMETKKAHFQAIHSPAIRLEVAAFANAIATGKVEQRASPGEAFMDLRVLQAMLESGEEGGAVQSLE